MTRCPDEANKYHAEPRAFVNERWRQLVCRCGLDAQGGERVFASLARAYAEPHRHYHNLAHVAHILDVLKELPALEPCLLELAAWFHDVVYDPRANDNEERSAAVAREALRELNLPADQGERVGQLILLTKGHAPPADDADAQLLLDADLAILGASPEAYDRYAEAIRREYAWVPEPAYRAGRSAVLRHFLDRPALYGTDELRRRWEAQARQNLRRELAALADGQTEGTS